MPGLLLIGVEAIVLPYVRVRNWPKYEGTVVKLGRTFPDGRNCQVRYTAADGAQLMWVDNRCAGSVKAGDRVTVYFNPQVLDEDPRRVEIHWTMAVVPLLMGGLGLVYGFDWPRRPGGRRVLYRDPFRMLSPYWQVWSKHASASKGVLTIRGSANQQSFPFTAWLADPGAIDLRIASPQAAGGKVAGGILFGNTVEAPGVVFGLVPHSQTAFARRLSPGRSADLMSARFVPEIRPKDGDWNALPVEIADGRASFFVNGGQAGSVEYASPIGGGMAGVYAEFDGSQSSWKCSDFVVMA